MVKEIDEKRKIWEELSKEEQDEKFELFIELIEAYNQNEYTIYKLICSSEKSVLQKHSNELVRLIYKYKEQIHFVQKIWNVLSKEVQKENAELLVDIMDRLSEQNKDIYQIWKNTDKEVQEKLLKQLLDGREQNKTYTLQLFKGLNIQPSEEMFKEFFRNCTSQTEYSYEFYQVYQNIFNHNKDVNETIELGIFNSKVLEMFDSSKLARITNYPEMQNQILELIKINGFEAVLSSIIKDNDNWVMELDNILKNIKAYPELVESISQEDIDENTATKLIQVFSQKKNYFNISNVSEARDYFNIRKDICIKLLNNEKIENLSPILESYSDEEKKRFALLELLYGIDIEEANNLIQKYGKDIEEIDPKRYGENTVLSLIGIKRILDCRDISRKYQENRSIIHSELETIEYSSIEGLEANCINIYTKMYEETLYKPEGDKVEEVEYDGNSISVYEISGDFNMFVRSEGACNGWQEPENFADALSRPTTKHHGNCKSYIGQDSIAIPNSQGVIYGYSSCERDSLLLAAPWDIMSNGANIEFSTASTKWDFNCGVQFRTPQKVIDNTRHAYNEFDSERLIYDENRGEFQRDKPQYVVYVQEADIDRETDEKWRISKKAASQIGVPIVIIEREKIAKRELEKLEEMEAIFLGNAENKGGIPETELLESIILKFENNITGDKGRYFTAQMRSQMIKRLWGKISSLKDMNLDRYIGLLDKFTEIVQNEEDKCYSNTGKEIAVSRYGKDILNTLRQKQEEVRGREERHSNMLMEKYQELGIEQSDLVKGMEFLRREKQGEKGEIHKIYGE